MLLNDEQAVHDYITKLCSCYRWNICGYMIIVAARRFKLSVDYLEVKFVSSFLFHLFHSKGT